MVLATTCAPWSVATPCHRPSIRMMVVANLVATILLGHTRRGFRNGPFWFSYFSCQRVFRERQRGEPGEIHGMWVDENCYVMAKLRDLATAALT